jgi:hypothetical protein
MVRVAIVADASEMTGPVHGDATAHVHPRRAGCPLASEPVARPVQRSWVTGIWAWPCAHPAAPIRHASHRDPVKDAVLA